MLEWYKIIILSTQLSGMAKITDSFLAVVLSLNSNESSNTYLSADVLVLLIAALCDGNLFALNTIYILEIWTVKISCLYLLCCT